MAGWIAFVAYASINLYHLYKEEPGLFTSICAAAIIFIGFAAVGFAIEALFEVIHAYI